MALANPMQRKVVVDTGPLVSILRENDQAHPLCTETIRALQLPLWTTWAVITEAAWLLRRSAHEVDSLIVMLELQTIRCTQLGDDFAPWCREMLKEYRDLKPQLADLTLLYIAEEIDTNTIFTLDRRDFTVFRNSKGEPFELLPEAFPG